MRVSAKQEEGWGEVKKTLRTSDLKRGGRLKRKSLRQRRGREVEKERKRVRKTEAHVAI